MTLKDDLQQRLNKFLTEKEVNEAEIVRTKKKLKPASCS